MIVEIDYSKYLSAPKVPLFVASDLRKCSKLWRLKRKFDPSAPVQVSEGSRCPPLPFVDYYEWEDWSFSEGSPNIPKTALLERVFADASDDSGADMRELTQKQADAFYKTLSFGNEFTLILVLGEVFKEGILTETAQKFGSLTKVFAVLGRPKVCQSLLPEKLVE